MPYEIIAAVCVGVIALILLLMKTNAGVVFFSVCAGSVLATQLGSEASLISSTVIKDGDINKSVAYIILIAVPAILSAIFLRGSVTSGKFIFNVVPSIAVGALLTLLIVPLLPPGLSSEVLQSDLWKQLQQFQPLILVGGVISSIVLLWFTHQKSKKDKKKHKKHS
jgi:hypothetical protein